MKTMRTETCGNCGRTANVRRENYHFEEMGLPVELMRIDVVRCQHCGNVDPIIPNFNDLMDAIALAVICMPCKLDGQSIRFLRKYVHKSAAEFARLMHWDATHLSKVENEHLDTGDQADKLIRFVVLSMSPDLQNKASRLLATLPDIEDEPCKRPEIQVDSTTLDYQYA